jgi:hypothetical protein
MSHLPIWWRWRWRCSICCLLMTTDINKIDKICQAASRHRRPGHQQDRHFPVVDISVNSYAITVFFSDALQTQNFAAKCPLVCFVESSSELLSSRLLSVAARTKQRRGTGGPSCPLLKTNT